MGWHDGERWRDDGELHSRVVAQHVHDWCAGRPLTTVVAGRSKVGTPMVKLHAMDGCSLLVKPAQVWSGVVDDLFGLVVSEVRIALHRGRRDEEGWNYVASFALKMRDAQGKPLLILNCMRAPHLPRVVRWDFEDNRRLLVGSRMWVVPEGVG